jgi:hypothetical protein
MTDQSILRQTDQQQGESAFYVSSFGGGEGQVAAFRIFYKEVRKQH